MTRLPILCLILALANAAPALAHPRVVSASPARGAVLKASPARVRVGFSEALEADVSILQLKDAAGRPVRTGKMAADPKDRQALVLPLPSRLAPGRYTVEWYVVSEDHASVPGRYRFEIRP